MTSPSFWNRQFTRVEGPDFDTAIDFSTFLLGDPFADYLRQDNHLYYRTFDDILSDVTKTAQFSVKIYAIGDGSYVDQKTVPYLSPHVRLLAVATLQQNTSLKFFVVGPLDVALEGGFLQVASWNGSALNFFAVDDINGGPTRGWTHQGSSEGAFADGDSYDSSYLGPFNGHINGGTIMKELHRPWYHWLSSENSNFLDCISPEALEKVKKIPYLLGNNGSPLAGAFVDSADNLEPIIKDTLINWYGSRVTMDFCDPTDASHQTPLSQPHNVHRWMAHLLMTTTVNFAASDASNATSYTIPNDLFYNAELLASLNFKNGKNLLPTSTPVFKANMGLYDQAIKSLRICLLQEVVGDAPSTMSGADIITLKDGTLGGGKQTDANAITTFVQTLPNSEGVPFVCLQTSLEDAQGVLSMQKRIQTNGSKFPKGLLSETAVQAILMLDFCNPVYSWRRGVLMQYLPQSTNLIQSASGPVYDLEQQFVDAIGKSPYLTDTSSPEFQFLQLYNTPPTNFQTTFQKYFANIIRQLKTLDGVTNYLTLAESRRRIYRPLPLDEFGAQLPYALGLDVNWQGVEMTPEGTIVSLPPRGVNFFTEWTKTLQGFDPHILPTGDCYKANFVPLASGSRCPVMAGRNGNASKPNGRSGCPSGILGQTDGSAGATVTSPTWDDDVAALFSTPYWVSDPAAVGSAWIKAMWCWSPTEPKEMFLNFESSSSVQRNIKTIYDHLRSQSMPITNDPTEYWPEEALETLRTWANQGFRLTAADKIVPQIIIQPSDDPPMRVRKDILSLSADELRIFREKLDTVLGIGELSSKWQELGLLHSNWCLHYQQATFFWHRAYLAYVEKLIDSPIPYWNGFAADTSDPDSPNAGLPSIFLDETYVDSAGVTRPNPLKYARAYSGRPKSTTSGVFVERYAVLSQGRSPSDPAWADKVHLFGTYHAQVAAALDHAAFSVPEDSEGTMGLPWANLPAFSDRQDPGDYPARVRDMYFDGGFELAHDNYHGWVGRDMANNSYAAFDPVFLCLHANLDRLVEMYLRRSPAQQLTASFPLRPFVAGARDLAYDEPRAYVFATIGDMAKPSQALGYLYAPPATPDFLPVQTPLAGVHDRMEPHGGSSVLVGDVRAAAERKERKKQWHHQHQQSPAGATGPKPKIMFADVACTTESFEIDVFVGGTSSSSSSSLEPSPSKNPAFIGRMTRLGMGDGGGDLKNAQRCHKPSVSRVLDAAAFDKQLREAKAVKQVVRRLATGEVVPEEEWKQWPGFEAKVMWL